jgi:DNA-binding transcriptional ArsR family regulator
VSDDPLDDAVRAMGHPGRRAMLRLARDGERTATELAEAAGLSPSAASPHLKVLREAGLMHVRVDARRRLYRVDFERLAAVRTALDELWDDRLGALARTAEATARTRATSRPAANRRRPA